MQIKSTNDDSRFEIFHSRQLIGTVAAGAGGWYFQMIELPGLTVGYRAPGINYKSKNAAAKELLSRFKFSAKAAEIQKRI